MRTKETPHAIDHELHERCSELLGKCIVTDCVPLALQAFLVVNSFKLHLNAFLQFFFHTPHLSQMYLEILGEACWQNTPNTISVQFQRTSVIKNKHLTSVSSKEQLNIYLAGESSFAMAALKLNNTGFSIRASGQ